MPATPAIQYKVHLTDEEKRQLAVLIHQGKSTARSQTRAHILVKAAAGVQDKDIIRALEVSPAWWRKPGTVRERRPGSGAQRASLSRLQAPMLTDKQAAHLIAMTSSESPAGHVHGTRRLLSDPCGGVRLCRLSRQSNDLFGLGYPMCTDDS